MVSIKYFNETKGLKSPPRTHSWQGLNVSVYLKEVLSNLKIHNKALWAV